MVTDLKLPAPLAGTRFVLGSTVLTHFGAGTINELPGIVRSTGSSAVLVVTDPMLATTPVMARVLEELAKSGIRAAVFAGVHPNPTTRDVAAGAQVAARLAMEVGLVTLVALGGGSSIDAAKGIALAAVNPERGRGLDYRKVFAHRALPIVAIPTTAGTGAETNAFGVVTDPDSRRKFYVGDATTLPFAAILDPELTISLPRKATAATGMDALVHALESFMSVRSNPWSAGIALQVIRMVSTYLPRAVADGSDREARSQMLLASHMAAVGMANTGLGICHAIAHPIGGLFDIAHGEALAAVLPGVLRFNLPACEERLAAVAFACGVGDTSFDDASNAAAAIRAITALAIRVGLTRGLADFGIAETDFHQIATDALGDEVIDNTPRPACEEDILGILYGALAGAS